MRVNKSIKTVAENYKYLQQISRQCGRTTIGKEQQFHLYPQTVVYHVKDTVVKTNLNPFNDPLHSKMCYSYFP